MRSAILFVLCISFVGNAEVVTRSQVFPFILGGSPISFTLNEINNIDDVSKLSCVLRFPDGQDSIEIEPSVTRDRQNAICRLPAAIKSGSVDVDLEITTMSTNTEILSEAVLINPSPLAEVDVEENWTTNELLFKWDPEYFKKFFNPGATIMIQATLYVSDGFDAVFSSSGIVQLIGMNVGTAKVSVTNANIDRISNIRYPYFYVLSPVALQSDVYLSSVLFAPTLGMDDTMAQRTCGLWMEIAKIPSPSDEIHPCPPCLCQVKLDTNFIETEYNPQIVQLANGGLDNHVIYYEQVPTNGGHAQTCSYNNLTNNLAVTSPAQAGWIHDVSKFNSYTGNYLADVWPYIVCCLQSNSQLFCDLFHEKRPIDTGHRYPGPEKPCKGTGDPHMVTFESIKYDFMGWGEFWLIRGPEDSKFGVQGRMSPIFEDQKVSYFKAVAIRDGNTTIQIQLRDENFEILLNGIEFQIPTSPMTLPLYSISLTVGNDRVDVRLQSGFTIIVENVKNFINVFGSGAHWNKGKGFMGLFGNFDDDSSNDLTSQDGFVIPPTEANLHDLSLLHHRFGLTWMTTATESFFIYDQGMRWEDYANRNFGPISQYPDPATLPEEVRAICGDSLFCYFEYVGTESLEKAADVARWEQEFDKLREEMEKVVPMCETISSPTNGRVKVEGHLNGSLAIYSCNREYDFMGGDRIRTCSASDEISYWVGTEPTCICKWNFLDEKFIDYRSLEILNFF